MNKGIQLLGAKEYIFWVMYIHTCFMSVSMVYVIIHDAIIQVPRPIIHIILYYPFFLFDNLCILLWLIAVKSEKGVIYNFHRDSLAFQYKQSFPTM